MFPHAVLEIVLSDYFAIGTHLAGADIALADVRASGTFTVHIFMHIRKFKNILKRVSPESHHLSKKWITAEASEPPHELMHVSEGVMHVHPGDLLAVTVASLTHDCGGV